MCSMSLQTEISFHEVQPTDALEASIQRWSSRLEHVHDGIVYCHVTVSQSHRHSLRGRVFELHVKVDIGSCEIVASAQNIEVYLAVADAFRAARRQLLDELGVGRGKARPAFVTRYVTAH